MYKKRLFAISMICGFTLISNVYAETNVTNIEISTPQDGKEISRKPVKVKGKIEYTGNFNNAYSVWLYKTVDAGFYWQDSGVILSGKQWSGKVWPQEQGFSPSEKKACEKLEEVVAVIYRKGDAEKLPGYNAPGKKISKIEMETALPNNIGLTMSLPVEYVNKFPCK